MGVVVGNAVTWLFVKCGAERCVHRVHMELDVEGMQREGS